MCLGTVLGYISFHTRSVTTAVFCVLSIAIVVTVVVVLSSTWLSLEFSPCEPFSCW